MGQVTTSILDAVDRLQVVLMDSHITEITRAALRRLASGVSIASTILDGERYGLTISSFTSIALDPPIIMISVHSGSHVGKAIVAAQRFTVSVLGEEHLLYATELSQSYRPEISPKRLNYVETKRGIPAVPNALAILDCNIEQAIRKYSHILIFGTVIDVILSNAPDSPLLYYHQRFRVLEKLLPHSVSASP